MRVSFTAAKNTLQSCVKNSDTWLGSPACAPQESAPDRPRQTRAVETTSVAIHDEAEI